MKNRIVFLLVIVNFLFGICLYADDNLIQGTASFDKAEITIGEKVKYSITIDMPKDTKIEFPVIDSMLIEAGFAIRDFGDEHPLKLSKTHNRIKYWYILDTYVLVHIQFHLSV